jgi:hypothetical protein
MIGTIRKHSKWLWALIIVGTIASFVVFFTPGAGRSSYRPGSENYGSIDGVRVTKDDYVNAYREALLVYFVASGGDWPGPDATKNGFDLQRETYQRLFFIQKLKEYDIHVDSVAVAQAANEILLQFGRGKEIPFDTFVQQVLKSHVDAEDFERYIRHQLAIQQLASVIGLGGDLVTPQEAKSLYIRDNQELSTEGVFFSGSNYMAGVTAPTPGAIAEFYTNQMSAYRLPERVQVDYVAFGITNFMAEAVQQMAKLTNLNAMVDQVYEERGTNYYSEAKSPEEAKQKIREEMRHQLALGAARKKADEFASTLFDIEPVRAENLAALAGTNGLTVRVTAPFDEETGPVEFDGGANFAKEAFARTADEPFAGPLIGENAVYVISIKKRIPSEVPPLDSIRSKVVADYKNNEAVTLARQAGEAFVQTLTNGLTQGKTFVGICAGAKLKPLLVPPVSISTRDLPEIESYVTLYQFKQIAFSTPVGKASDFSPTRDGGMVVYVQQRLPVDQAKMAADMPEFLKTVHQARRQEAINLWIGREAGKQEAFVRDILFGRSKSSSTSRPDNS